MSLLERFAAKARKAGGLSASDRLLVVRAWCWVTVARLGVGLVSYPRFVRLITWRGVRGSEPPGGSVGRAGRNDGDDDNFGGPVTAPRAARIQRLAWAVDTAARNSVPPATCLPRSWALWRLLTTSGVRAEVRIGVMRPGDGTIAAHAWVEADGTVIGDSPDVAERFKPLVAGNAHVIASSVRGGMHIGRCRDER